MASVQRRKPECPLCRAAFPAAVPLTVNVELRDLVALAATLHTVEEVDGWQSLAAVKVRICMRLPNSCRDDVACLIANAMKSSELVRPTS